MDYEEFCDATGSNYGLLQQIYDSGAAIGQATNRKLMRDLRIYMAVGGMPQAVEAYVNGKNFSEIDMVKRQIISLYEEDFKLMRPEGYRHYIMRFRHSWQRMQENIVLPQQSEKEITRKQKNYYTS
mgnify:CR=1 FL=1